MGIRFHCPNGHKLNIKAFLAGKRGICPHCGVKFIIPTESGGTAELATKEQAGEAEPTEAEGVAQAASVAAGATSSVQPVNASTASATGSEPQASPVARPAQATAEPVSPSSQAAAATPAAVAAQPATPAIADPFEEAPNAVWYVRPRSGGQFGPAGADVMRQWMSEGRVAGDSLVWRDGWADWKPASGVFPQLAASAAAVPTPSVPAAATPVADEGPASFDIGGRSESRGASSPTSRPVRRRKSNDLTVMLVILLSFIAIILVVVFVYVLTRQSGSDEAAVSFFAEQPGLAYCQPHAADSLACSASSTFTNSL